MNLAEATKLVAECRALFPGMSLVPGIADAWHGQLGDLGYQECRGALNRHARSQPHIPSLAEIRRLALSARADLPPAAVESIGAARALQSSETSFNGLPIPGKPPWAQKVYEEALTRQREINAQRRADGLLPTFGETVRLPIDGRPAR